MHRVVGVCLIVVWLLGLSACSGNIDGTPPGSGRDSGSNVVPLPDGGLLLPDGNVIPPPPLDAGTPCVPTGASVQPPVEHER